MVFAVITSPINAKGLPHADVSPENYTRHISTSLSDPIRMRQLLLWIVQRAGVETGIDVGVLMEGLISRKINTSWYGKQKEVTEGGDAHPINVGNRERIAELEAGIAKIAGEVEQWDTLYETNEARRAEAVKRTEEIAVVLEGGVDVQAYCEGIVDMGMCDAGQRERIEEWGREDRFEEWITGIKFDVRVNVCLFVANGRWIVSSMQYITVKRMTK
jgi:hypothetical protein